LFLLKFNDNNLEISFEKSKQKKPSRGKIISNNE
jgi:hypothetical protein